jgi:hypothetical protein
MADLSGMGVPRSRPFLSEFWFFSLLASVRAQTHEKQDQIPIERCDRLPVVTMKVAGGNRGVSRSNTNRKRGSGRARGFCLCGRPTYKVTNTAMPERFVFSDLREMFAKANEEKSGDQLAKLGAAIRTRTSRSQAQARGCPACPNCPTAANRSSRRQLIRGLESSLAGNI